MQLTKTKNNIFYSFAAAFLCVVLFMLITYRNMRLSLEENKLMKTSIERIDNIQHIWLDIQSMDDAQRNFILSGNTNFLTLYTEGLNNLKTDTTNFSKKMLLSPKAKERFYDLALLLNERIRQNEVEIDLRKEVGLDAAALYLSKNHDNKLLEQIHAHTLFFENQDWQNLKTANSKTEQLTKKRKLQLLSLTFIFLVILFFNYLIINKDFELKKEKEKALKYNASIINSLYDAIITTDTKNNIILWNKYACDLYGYTEAEAIDKNILTLLKTVSINENKNETGIEIDKMSQWKGNLITYNKNKQQIFVEVVSSCLYNAKGETIGIVNVIRDITERIRTERSLKDLSDTLEKKVTIKVAELSNVFTRITDGFIGLDYDFNFEYINPKAVLLLELPLEKLIGKNIFELFPNLITNQLKAYLTEAKKTEKAMQVDLKDPNTGQWFENWIYPDKNGLSIYFRDITKRKNYEEQLLSIQKELQDSNERFSLLSKATNDALWDWDIKNNVMWISESCRELFGIEHQHDISFDEFMSYVDTEDREKLMTYFNESTHTQSAYLTKEYKINRTGQPALSVYARAYTLYEAGKAYRVLGAMQDITLKKNSEQQLLIEKELSDTLINSLPGIFYLFNEKGDLIRWNKNIEKITGRSADQISKMKPHDFVSETYHELLTERFTNVFVSGEDNLEADLKTIDNKTIPYFYTGMFIRYKEENCMMGVGIDISERKESQEEMKQLATHLQNIREEERSRIAREIHDELGQQLTGLKMDLSWLNKKLNQKTPETNSKMLDAMGLVNETIKTVRRIATQLRPSILDDLGLIAALDWQSEDFEKRYQIKTSFLSNFSDTNLSPEIAIGIFRIYQESLTNVLRHSNATEVKAELFQETGMLQLSISDNGIGFNSEEVENKKTLGLLGMKERTIMMGGSFIFKSGKGEGTSILIRIPLI